MGYWSRPWRPGPAGGRPLDPGPDLRSGQGAGKSDEQIWADYDQARAADDEQ